MQIIDSTIIQEVKMEDKYIGGVQRGTCKTTENVFWGPGSVLIHGPGSGFYRDGFNSPMEIH